MISLTDPAIADNCHVRSGKIWFTLWLLADSGIMTNLLAAYFLAVSADGIIVILHVVRRHPERRAEIFDSSKLSILIVCYNGEKVLGEAIRQALRHVPPSQVVVISDNSTDATEEVARGFGVRVYRNFRNMGKSMSINRHIHKVATPYTLILDDDTLIGDMYIPTSLLDRGYAAVAFKVMPIPSRRLVNRFQQFEYRKSMVIRKGLKASVGAVGNVSGAIGLFHTHNILLQAFRHSGQQGGEDQQRTNLTHLESRGRGVTYYPSVVHTLAPESWRALFRQRAFKWGTAAHENFVLLFQVLLHPDTHFLLKLEKAYSLFILLSEPFRILFLLLVLFAPIGSFTAHLLTILLMYVGIELLSWIKTRRQDPVWAVLLFPLYAKFIAIARFAAHFYWLKKKYIYCIRHGFHRWIWDRRLISEYLLVLAVLTVLWGIALHKFVINGRGWLIPSLPGLPERAVVAIGVSVGLTLSLPPLVRLAQSYGRSFGNNARLIKSRVGGKRWLGRRYGTAQIVHKNN